jgi:hypothetical protein
VDTVRDFFRFLIGDRITHLKMASGRYGKRGRTGSECRQFFLSYYQEQKWLATEDTV